MALGELLKLWCLLGPKSKTFIRQRLLHIKYTVSITQMGLIWLLGLMEAHPLPHPPLCNHALDKQANVWQIIIVWSWSWKQDPQRRESATLHSGTRSVRISGASKGVRRSLANSLNKHQLSQIDPLPHAHRDVHRGRRSVLGVKK